MSIKIFLLIGICFIVHQSYSQKRYTRPELTEKFSHTTGTYTDPRDGQVYQTITFIRQVDLATIKRTWFAENARYNVPGSFCYKNIDAYGEKFGRLYNYEGANKACPEGWHVPTIKEWEYLFDFFGGRQHAGQHLMEGKASDMHMLYGGFGEPGPVFKHITISGNWWDNELKDEKEKTAGIISIMKGSEKIYHSVVGDKHLLSCRCVKFH